MLAAKQCCLGEPEHRAHMKPGERVQWGSSKLDTSVIRSAFKGEKRKWKKWGEHWAACVV